MTVAKKLSGSGGPGRVDSTTMRRMLVCFGGHSARLRAAVANAKWPTVSENLEAGQAEIVLVVHTSDCESLEAGYSEILVIVHTANK